MKLLRLVPVAVLALSGVLASAGSAGAAAPPSYGVPPGNTYNCTGGDVPAGTYNSVVVTGVCYAPAGTIAVRGDLTVAPGALLDAVTPGDPAGNPLLPATVVVGGNVNVGRGAVLVLGCTPSQGCHAINSDRIGGNLNAIGALGVVLHGVSIGGSATLWGGGGGAAGGAASGACFASPIPAPWSEDAALSTGPNGTPSSVTSRTIRSVATSAFSACKRAGWGPSGTRSAEASLSSETRRVIRMGWKWAATRRAVT